MAEEEDFSKLSLEERWRHAKWSARQSAYKEALAIAEAGAPLPPGASSVDALSFASCDSNVVALDTGIKLLGAVVANCTEQVNIAALQNAALKSMLEKGLVATKPSVKQSAAAATLAFVEVVPNPNVVIEDLLAVLAKARVTRLQASVLSLLAQIYTEFGGPVADPKLVLKELTPQFANADKNVRASATDVAVALKRWVGVPALQAVLKDLKPVQLKELQEKWAAQPANNDPPARLTRRQAAAIEKAAAGATEAGDDADVPMDANDNAQEAEAIDPWELTAPVSVLEKIPANFDEQVSSDKWKERKEALEPVVELLKNTPRLAKGDYHYFVSSIERVVAKETNQQCAGMAVTIVRSLATGLRQDFAPYGTRFLDPLIERFREKKQSFVENVTGCLDALFSIIGLSPLLAALLGSSGLGHKVPVVKLETGKYIAHLLQMTTKPPTAAEIAQTGKAAIVLLNDTTEASRQAGAQILGALTKIAGPAGTHSLLNGIDDLRKAKVQDAAAKMTVNSTIAKPKAATAKPPAQPSKPGLRRPGALSGALPATRPGTTTMPAPGAKRTTLQPPSMRAPPTLPSPVDRKDPGTPFKRGNANRPPSADSDMVIASPPRGMSMPTTASTPKVPKRTSHTAEFTPLRQPVANRRRLVSPEKPGTISESGEQFEQFEPANPAALANLTMQLSNEKRKREQAEAALARSEAAYNTEVQRLTEKLAETQMQLDVARGELSDLQTQVAQSRMSSLTLNRSHSSSKERSERRHSQMFGNSTLTTRSNTDKRLSLDGQSTDTTVPAAEMYRPRTQRIEGRSDWERAVKVTADLRRRINDLKQERMA